MDKKKKRNYFLFLIFLSLIIFYNSLFFEFVWDDVYQIQYNYDLRTLTGLFKLISSSIPTMPIYYRPIFVISLFIDYHIWGLNPFGFHLTNLILNIFTNILIFLVTYKLFKSEAIAVISAIIFSIHPTHSESVSYISARNELLCGFFLIHSFLFYVKYRIDKSYKYFLIMSNIFYILALFSKETAITLPFLIVLYEYSFQNDGIGKKWRLMVFFFLTTLVYLIIRMKFSDMPKDINPVLHRATTFTKVVFYDLLILFFPFFHKTFYQTGVLSKIKDLYLWLYIIFLAIIICFSIYLFKKEKRLFFSLGWIIITLLPVTTLITFIYPALIAERYLYIPSIGLSMFLGVFYYDVYCYVKNRYGIYAVILKSFFVIVTTVFIIITFIRNFEYKSNIDLWYRARKANPYDPYVVDKLASIYLEKKYYSQAEVEYLRLEIADSQNPQIHHRLGNLYKEWGKFDLAEKRYLMALNVAPDYFVVLPDLGDLYVKMQLPERAFQVYIDYLNLDNRNYYVFYALAELFFQFNDFDTSVTYINKALEINPNFDKPYYLLGSILENQKRYKEALDVYQKAQKLMPLEKKYKQAIEKIQGLLK